MLILTNGKHASGSSMEDPKINEGKKSGVHGMEGTVKNNSGGAHASVSNSFASSVKVHFRHLEAYQPPDLDVDVCIPLSMEVAGDGFTEVKHGHKKNVSHKSVTMGFTDVNKVSSDNSFASLNVVHDGEDAEIVNRRKETTYARGIGIWISHVKKDISGDNVNKELKSATKVVKHGSRMHSL